LSSLLVQLAPVAFVVLWSTGYIAAKFALADAEPMSFLAWRYALVVLILAAIVVARRHPWPTRPADYLHSALTGVSLHCLGLGGVFLAIDREVEAGVSALIMALQPVLTALFATVALRERLTARQLIGLLLGFSGVTLVVAQRLDSGAGSLDGVAWNALGMVAVTTGTLYQKARSQNMNPYTGTTIQFTAAALACVVLSFAFDETATRWTPQVVGALAWAVLVLSVVATSLLYWLIRHGAMTAVSSLFYLVPLSAAVLAWALFDERLAGSALIGMVVTVVGVSLVTRPSTSKPSA
jgi:drug/metabolite transporter (DMT)-like permease